MHLLSRSPPSGPLRPPMPPALFALFLAVSDSAQPGEVYNGRAGQIEIATPRIEAAITVDGALSEPAWGQAARLTGFSQFQPADQRAATNVTEVLIWYSPTAIHFGIRAFSPPGTVNAKLSDRDKISSEDYVEIILSTFNDGRQAFVFGVNALGVQADGTLNEVAATSSSGNSTAARTSPDLSANFAYDSKGRVTQYGYEVEVRIPFKSLRYQPRAVQDWGVQVVRRVAHLGHEDTWTPARRDAASFLAQAGKLKGMRDLRRGVVVDINPSVVAFQNGAPATDGDWKYSRQGPEYGGQVKWGISNNLTLNGAVNPDFSQIEADVVSFQYDPRSALFYPERRPFFLEGIENFSVGNNLIYTRRIVQPDVAVKLTGKALGTNLALLTALDDRSTSVKGGHPLFNVVRAVRDVGSQSRVGLVLTGRDDAGDYNRVIGADARLIARKSWSLTMQGALSRTRLDSVTTTAPLWAAALARSGRTYNFNARINAVDRDFDAQAGFISRTDVADYVVANNWTFYRRPGSRLETWNFVIRGSQTSSYDALVNGRASQDRKLHITGNAALRGGWRLSGGFFFENFGFDPELYSQHYIERDLGTRKDTVKFTAAGDPRLHNVDFTFTIGTPQWPRFFGDFFYVGGKDENFEEWQSGLIHFVTVNAHWRPTDQLRVDGQYQHQQYNRWADGSMVSVRKVPRLRVEYQATRAIFFRLVGQYDAQEKDVRRDDQRTNFPLLLRSPNGSYTRLGAVSQNRVRADWLFSYQPTPGTVFFLGYGSTLQEPEPLRFRSLTRTVDGFFVKWSYLYRL